MNDQERLKWAFEQSQTLFQTAHHHSQSPRRARISNRLGHRTKHPVTGRTLKQGEGPMKFVSKKDPLPLTRLEEALICWAACGPNGLVAWDISLDGGFHELTWIAGRTVACAREIRARPTCSSSTTRAPTSISRASSARAPSRSSPRPITTKSCDGMRRDSSRFSMSVPTLISGCARPARRTPC